jgi:hypothetical protein
MSFKQPRADANIFFSVPRRASASPPAEGYVGRMIRLTFWLGKLLSADEYDLFARTLPDNFSSINNDREGVIYIQDLAGARWNTFGRVPQPDMKELLGAMRHAMPLRIRAIHILNAPWYLRILIAMVSPFLKSKVLERVRSQHCCFSSLSVTDRQ